MRMLLNVLRFTAKSLQEPRILQTVNVASLRKCNYARWMSREPVAIENEDEMYERDEDEEQEKLERKMQQKAKKTRSKTAPKKKKAKAVKVESPIRRTEIGNKIVNYIFLRDNDALISKMLPDMIMRKNRKHVVLEGHRLIKEAIENGAVLEVLFFTRISDLALLPIPDNTKLYKVPYRTLQLWSTLSTSPGITGIFQTPNIQKEVAENALPLTVVCDNIREPGNLGTILRAAAGVGCEKIILLKGCVDVWDSKVMRSAAGTHFRIPIYTHVSWKDIPSYISGESTFYITDNNLEFVSDACKPENSASTVEEAENTCAAEANEAENTDATVVRETENTYAAEANEAENTDATVVRETENMYAKEAQEAENVDTTKEKDIEYVDKIDDNSEEYSDSDSETQEAKKDEIIYPNSYKAKQEVRKFISKLPIVPYYSTDYTSSHVVLVIGGETEGLNIHSLEILQDIETVRVNIPLANGVESLNAGVALGVVAFEIKKQFLQKMEENK